MDIEASTERIDICGDIDITCQICGEKFPFSEREQRFFDEMGFVTPRYCPQCRKSKKRETSQKNSKWKDIFTVNCDNCGVETTVPFKPVHGRPVYCRQCLTELRDDSQVHDDHEEHSLTYSNEEPANKDNIMIGLSIHADAARPYDALDAKVNELLDSIL